MMHYTTELLDDNTLLFRFTVPAEEYTAALDEAWRTHKARYPVPGMRDGKASRTMIERFRQESGAHLTIMEGGEHWFHTPVQMAVLQTWEETNV